MFENKILVIEEQIKSIVHQLKTIGLISPQKRREYRVNQKIILTGQIDFLIEYLRSIPQDLDYLESGLDRAIDKSQMLEISQVDRFRESANTEIDSQPIASINEIESTSDDVISDIQRNWIEEYNKVLALDIDNYNKEKDIRNIWSQLGLKMMSISNLDNIKASGYPPEFKESNFGVFYALPQNEYYLIFPIASLNIKNEVIQYTFNVEGNGDFIDRINYPAKVQVQGDKMNLVKKGNLHG